MIIWIDGVNGVGKSHVASKLAEKLVNYNAEYVESDVYWLKLNILVARNRKYGNRLFCA